MADEAASRALLLQSGTTEAVTVNQRALIDKILARYAAEFSIFREMIQNADDAGAEACELRFITEAGSAGGAATSSSASSSQASTSGAPNLKANLKSWIFKNNGKVFNSDDWARVKRIAEGNPNPDRIGQYGVGLYSIFAVSEEPFLASGSDLLGFFWKGDSLYTRRAQTADFDPWTSINMPLREYAPFPDSFLDLSRFLATALTFTVNVKRLALYFDDLSLCQLEKTMEPAKPLAMPSHLNASSTNRMMRVTEMSTTAMRVKVDIVKMLLDLAQKPKQSVVDLASAFTKSSGGGFASMLSSAFGRKEAKKETQPAKPAVDATSAVNAMTRLTSSVHVRIVTASAAVTVDRSFSTQIERSTKKPPPKITRIQVIAQNKDEADASVASAGDESISEVFKGIMPRLDTQGHIFIGFKTSQTSGCAAHIAGRFIPTVERESLDFVDKYCAQWNNELLAVSGLVTRVIYETELAEIDAIWKQKIGPARPKDGDETVKWLLDRALHVVKFFTFRASTPSSRVFSGLETRFFDSARQATLTLASNRGVKSSAHVRFPNAILGEFIKDLPVIPAYHVEAAGEFISQVKRRNLVNDISMADVFAELAGRPLPVPEMLACLKWWISVSNHASYDPSLRRQLLDNAIVEVQSKDEKSPSKLQQLATVTTYLNTSRIPTDLPVPDSCLTYELSKDLIAADMHRVFGWSELTLAAWTQFIASEARRAHVAIESNIQLSPTFAEKCLLTLARSWGSLSSQQQEKIIGTLGDVPCVPTKLGICKPGEAYFANVSLFEDLAIVEFPTAQVKGNLEKLLAALGVRRHVDLQIIFSRLIGSGDWDIAQLVTYLATNKDTLSSLELERLTKTAMFPKEGEVGPPGKDGKSKIVRYRASQLYEPTDALRELKLPIMDWPSKKQWRSSSDEAKFVFSLGLQRHPPIETLLQLASTANTDEVVQQKAFTYLLEHIPGHYRKTYSATAASQFAFVPCTLSGKRVLKPPSEACTSRDAQILGFPIVSEEVSATDVAKLGLRAHPTSAQLLAKVTRDPTHDVAIAKKVFEYLAAVPDFTPADYRTLSGSAFIPVQGKGSDKDASQLVRPSECYFDVEQEDTPLRKVLRDVFTFINFGERAAVFLRNCGVTNEPSTLEVASQLVQMPQRFYQVAGEQAYLSILRQIATNWQQIPSRLRNEMKRSAFLLASKRLSSKAKSATKSLIDQQSDDEGEEEEQGVLVHDLKRASDIVVVDDASAQLLFASVIFAAPHDDAIEAMATELGARRLSSLVDERYEAAGNVLFDTPRCKEVLGTVLERTPMFIFEEKQSRIDIRHDADWLKANLQVAEVDGRGLRLTRHLRFNNVNVSNEQRCSAMASKASGKLVLYIASVMDIDWYEVALALSHHLLKRQRLQEVLLYMSLLSTSLRNLKRRGFNVDKILSQRQADREAAERLQREKRARAELEAASRPSESQIKQWAADVRAVFPDADPAYVEQQLRAAKSDHVATATNALLEQPYPKVAPPKPFAGPHGVGESPSPIEALAKREPQPPSSTSLLSSWRNRFKSSSSSAGEPPIPGGWTPGQTKYPIKLPESSSSNLEYAQSINESVASPQVKETTARNPNAGVTPANKIRATVLSAINASRGTDRGAGDRVQSAATETQVKEAQSTYCDSTGVAQDLRLAGKVAGMDVYVSRELDPSTTLTNNSEGLQRYIDTIIRPIIGVFDLDPRSVHVFVDVSGPSVAFNRGGQLFLNFRYYLIWHDEEVQRNDRTNALVSTYHSLAHELAHNLVAQHDSEHEWWFSSISENYFVKFAELVTRVQAESEHRPARISS